MIRYRLDLIESLARQMTFAPATVREKQIQAAETLLLSIDPAKAYPPAYVVYRITDYRPDTAPADLATGLALQHDLGLLIERVSMSLDDRTADRAEPVLQIDDLVAQFNVTSKTIQRWRRRGLAARRFIFPDGKRRVGFRLGVVEQFFAAHRQSLQTTVNCSRIAGDEWATVRRHTLRLAADPRRPVDEIASRVGRRVGRTALAIEAELRKHDAEMQHAKTLHTGPADAVLIAGRPASTPPATIDTVQRLLADGLSLSRVAAVVGLPRSTVFGLALAARVARTLGRRNKFLDDPLYHQLDADAVLAALLAQDPILAAPCAEQASRETLRGLSAELASICRHAVLTTTQERALFLQYNFRKFQAAQARHRLDPACVRRGDLSRIDSLLARATDLRNRLVRANLRLVVSVAKKHVRPGISLPELVNEGSLTLMRAVESFDTRRGNKFSTYATLALMKGFARTVGRLRAGPTAFGLIDNLADRGRCAFDQVDAADRVDRLLAPLTTQERSAVCRQFDLTRPLPAGAATDATACRRVERRAMEKLRASAGHAPRPTV